MVLFVRSLRRMRTPAPRHRKIDNTTADHVHYFILVNLDPARRKALSLCLFEKRVVYGQLEKNPKSSARPETETAVQILRGRGVINGFALFRCRPAVTGLLRLSST